MDITSKRIKRIADFDDFYNNSELLFKALSSNDERCLKFNAIYSLNIVPGGRNGGLNTKQIEVFYGHRVVGFKKQITNEFRIESINEIENGASLAYNRLDDGKVACVLYPAISDNKSSHEDGILIELCSKPIYLKRKIKRHLSYLNSYMEVTSLDGSPTIFDKLKVSYLRYFKIALFDGKSNSRVALSWIREVADFVLKVGLSGFLVFIFTTWMNSSENERREDSSRQLVKQSQQLLVLINSNSESLHNLIDSTNTLLNSRNAKCDSLSNMLNDKLTKLVTISESIRSTIKRIDSSVKSIELKNEK